MEEESNPNRPISRGLMLDFTFLTPWALQLVAMGLTVMLIPKLELSSISGLVLILVAIALVNAFLWEHSLFYFLPESLTARSLQLLLVNGLIFWVLVKLLPGIETEGLLPCLVAPVLFTAMSYLTNTYGRQVDWGTVLHNSSVIVIDVMHRLRDSLASGSS